MADFPNSAAQSPTGAQVLLDAEEAAKRGDHERAYKLSLGATQIAPNNIKAWLLRAETTSSIDEAVSCLNQANSLLPSDPEAKGKTYRIMQKLLKQDPFVLYLDESDVMYHVRSGEKLSLIVPKDRAVPDAYPAERPALLRNAFRWLGMALIGLPLAGLGGIIFAPLAAISAVGLYLKSASKTNRIHSLVVIILAGGLWLSGLLLGVILLVHLI